MPPDEFDTMIQNVMNDPHQPAQAAGPRQPYPVLRFALGTVLFLVAAILADILVRLLHG